MRELLRGIPARTVDLDVLSEENANGYWDRDERFDLAIRLNRGQPSLTALCRALERWVEPFLAVEVTTVALGERQGERRVLQGGGEGTGQTGVRVLGIQAPEMDK